MGNILEWFFRVKRILEIDRSASTVWTWAISSMIIYVSYCTGRSKWQTHVASYLNADQGTF